MSKIWLGLGVFAQLMFSARFLVQWLANWTAREDASISLKIAAFITMIGAFGLLAFPFLQPFLKGSFPVLTIFRVSAADWRLWALLGLGIAAGASY